MKLVQENFSNLDRKKQLLIVDLLDYVVDNGSQNLLKDVSDKGFFSFLITLLRMKDSADLQVKILGMIEKWGKKFESNKQNLPNFTEVYNSLKKNGVTFPINFK